MSDFEKNTIVLKSVYGKVGMKYMIQPCRDKKTGRFPDCVKRVNSQGDMIMTDAERNSGKVFIPEDKMFTIQDGTTFDLTDEYQAAEWEAIKNCPLIAPSRYAKDASGNLLIDGTMGWKNKTPRYGIAELYIDMPGVETANKVTRKKLIHQASEFIFTDPQGLDGLLTKCKLLGKNLRNLPAADVEDYLLQVAEKNPKKIIDLYTGTDTKLRLLFVDAREKKVIYTKNKLFMYADNIILGATDDAVITWMQQPKNQKILNLIMKDTYPDMYPDDEIKKDVKTDSKK